MASYAAPAPWYQGVKETTVSGKHKARLVSGNMEWDLTTSWHPKRERGWIKKNSLDSKTMRNTAVWKQSVVGPDGKTYQVYKTRGYDDYIGFHSHDEPEEEALDYALNAFDRNDPSHGPIYKQEGCGHISKIEYAQQQQVLRVTFASNGAICIFFRVPSAVAGTLISLAKSGATRISSVDGTQRHVLGMEFWDLVRIRGQRHGARYPFEYLKRGEYKLTHSNKRYRVVLSDENIKTVLGGRYYGRELKPGETISAILSEEEFARYMQDKAAEGEHKQSKLGVKSVYDSEKGRNVELTGYEMEDMLESSYTGNKVRFEDTLSPQDAALWKELNDKVRKARADYTKGFNAATGSNSGLSKAELDALWKKAAEKFPDDMMKQVDYVDKMNNKAMGISGSSFDERSYDSYKGLKSSVTKEKSLTLKEIFGNDTASYSEYKRLNSMFDRYENPLKYASIQNGRGWSVQELQDFANPTIPGAISIAHAPFYQRLIQMREYETALDYLKRKHHDIYVNGKVVARNRPYASPHDFIIE